MPKKKPKAEPIAGGFVILPAAEPESQLLRTEPEPVVEQPPVRNRLTAEEIRIAHRLAEWGRK